MAGSSSSLAASELKLTVNLIGSRISVTMVPATRGMNLWRPAHSVVMNNDNRVVPELFWLQNYSLRGQSKVFFRNPLINVRLWIEELNAK